MNKIVIFYEKPGCATNTKQKQILRDAGCMVIARSLLEHGMNAEELYAFLEGRGVAEWFNPNAPKVKSGEIDPAQFDEASALKLLMMEPILIRRPLLVIDSRKICGFDQQQVEALLGTPLGQKVGTACSSAEERCPPPHLVFRSQR